MATSKADLPPADAPQLVLTRPTDEEKEVIWKQTHLMWGRALTEEMYLEREVYLTTVPLSVNGGITHWILTDSTKPPNQRPILSSCESIRKPALASYQKEKAAPSPKTVVDGITHGIASVFTDPEYRGRGYAGRMLTELGPRLVHWQVKSVTDIEKGLAAEAGKAEPEQGDKDEKSLFSVLYSDIGKKFYASKGWEAFPSSHYSFPPDENAIEKDNDKSKIEPLGYHEFAALCVLDEANLRERMAFRAAAHPGEPCAAIVPNMDTLLWHLMREDYMVKHIFKETPTIRGAVYGGLRNKEKRMWAIWTRGYYGGLTNVKDNTFHILRVVLEDIYDDEADQVTPEHVEGFRAIFRLAQSEAAKWKCNEVELWNPTAALKKMAKDSGLPFTEHDREDKSIASLMWYGDEETKSVEWVANEKYGWC